MSLKTVFEPIQIGPVTVKNRVVRTAHDTGMARPDISDTLIGYHEARARGGCGLTILEASSVHPSSDLHMQVYGDRIVPGYQRLMAAVNPHGMKVFQQLWHGGNLYYGPNGVPLGVSDAPGFSGIVGLPMTEDDIAEIIAAFAQAARNARDGGLHGVEVHCAHGYIMHQFLSAVTNTRTDRWGGDFEGRSRFLMETLRAVRAAVGGEIAVGVRLSASKSPGGVSQADNVRVVGMLQDENLVDFVDVSSGDYFSFDQMVGAMHQPTGYELPNSAEILAAVRVPRIVAGRYRTLEEADQAIRDGFTDMVSMVRAQIADPDLVAKTQAGKAEQVRPCLGCNQGCGGGLAAFGVLGCTINPAVAKEAQLSEHLIVAAAEPKRVVVIGGGPAGMEAARVSALQGHSVVLLEASAQLGGQVNVAKRAPKQQSLGDVTWWQEQELYRLGVDIRLGTYAEADDVRALAPDVVYVATGSWPANDGFVFNNPGSPVRGVDQPHVLSAIDVFTNTERRPGKHAVIFDTFGGYEAIGAAEHLVEQGCHVTLLSAHAITTPTAMRYGRDRSAIERMTLAGKFRAMTLHRIVEIGPDWCSIAPVRFDPADPERLPADTVVLVSQNLPMRQLWEDLRGDAFDLRLVGDARTPRDLQVAIAEAHVMARG